MLRDGKFQKKLREYREHRLELKDDLTIGVDPVEPAETDESDSGKTDGESIYFHIMEHNYLKAQVKKTKPGCRNHCPKIEKVNQSDLVDLIGLH